jgi:MFS family permease
MPKPQAAKGIWKVITASSVGTLIEWYDFYIFGSLAIIISKQFFPQDQSTAALLSTLAIFAAGFIVRPFGALVFGRIGDIIGRKYTFMVTLVLMGGATFLIGVIPTYKDIGMAAPFLILLLRLVQGLALGGEYGGAATYVAEHAPEGRRGFYTSWIQTTATLGLFLSLGVILFTRSAIGSEAFYEWGWRIPFLLSAVLVLVSIVIRLKMKESPLFTELKKSGQTSKNPLKESFTKKENLSMVLLALFGAVMGQGVIWYTGQFYAQSFIENTCKVDFEQSRTILLWAILFATPFFVIFGWLSDKYGRKWIMLGGMLLGVLFYRSIYREFLHITNMGAKTEQVQDRQIQKNQKIIEGTDANLVKTDTVRYYSDGAILRISNTDTLYSTGKTALKPLLKVEKTLGQTDYILMILLVFVQILFVTMVYGPMAAFLVELFPTRIRYSSMSLPYHIGNGVFGGLVPFIGTLIIEYTKTTSQPMGNPLAGLNYPIGIASLCFVIGLLFLSNNKHSFHWPLTKKVTGIILMAIGPLSIAMLIYFASLKLAMANATFNDVLQWTIIIAIFIPIVIGFILFGKYALHGEYDKKVKS